MELLYGGIEGGGTKFICAVGTGLNNILAEARVQTTKPKETLGKIINFFHQQQDDFGKLAAIGFSCFGPLDLNPASHTYGYILPTPKPGWSNKNVVGILRSAFDIPIGFDTDVNAAALGERQWGMGQGLNNFIYLTLWLAHVEGIEHKAIAEIVDVRPGSVRVLLFRARQRLARLLDPHSTGKDVADGH